MMLSFDTNIAVYAANKRAAQHTRAVAFLQSLSQNRNVAVCELMLAELFLTLCNNRIFSRPLTPQQAAGVCQGYRDNQAWALIENAAVMSDVWKKATKTGFLSPIPYRNGHISGIRTEATSHRTRFSGTPTRRKSANRYPPAP